MNLVFLQSTFEEVAPVWQQHLWDSKYKFESTSSMLFLGGYDVEIPKKYTPFFWKAVCDNELAGVVSAHQTSSKHFRIRGLYVFEKFRRKTIASDLILLGYEKASTFDVDIIWAAPRKTNVSLFEKMGFERKSEPTSEGFLYGPNCYVSKTLIK